MDSGNSGSLQSSSGGDDEYDSRAAARSFFRSRPIATSPPPLFDPFSNYAQQLHMPWPRPASMRSDPDLSISHVAMNPNIFQAPTSAVGENIDLFAAAVQNQNMTARNPRKRPRASRRAPTTVLTTDTANFRAMVQEFTGIPSPPFHSSSLPRSRLDLFTSHQPPPPPYFRRPFVHKPQSPPPPPPFPVSSHYQLPITQSLNLFNVINPNNLTSLIQSNPKFLFSYSDVITSKPHDQDPFGIPTSDDHFSLSHLSTAPLNAALPNLVSPDHLKNPNNDENAETGRDGGYGFSDGKMIIFPASPPPPSDSRGGKDSENVAARGGGMVEAWICSSE